MFTFHSDNLPLSLTHNIFTQRRASLSKQLVLHVVHTVVYHGRTLPSAGGWATWLVFAFVVPSQTIWRTKTKQKCSVTSTLVTSREQNPIKRRKKWSISTRLFSIKTKDHDPGNTLHSDSSFIFVLFFLKEPDLLLQFVLLPLSESVKWGHGHAKDSVELLWWEVTLWKQKCQDKIVKKSEVIY